MDRTPPIQPSALIRIATALTLTVMLAVVLHEANTRKMPTLLRGSLVGTSSKTTGGTSVTGYWCCEGSWMCEASLDGLSPCEGGATASFGDVQTCNDNCPPASSSATSTSAPPQLYCCGGGGGACHAMSGWGDPTCDGDNQGFLDPQCNNQCGTSSSAAPVWCCDAVQHQCYSSSPPAASSPGA